MNQIKQAAKIKAVGRIVLLIAIAIYGIGLIYMRYVIEVQNKA